ncbi:hypothetical protein A2803_00280 [Candidatus Woesebacteria bacterium RIFCSPHIGHO2_01_FULL_44_21]|uniref:Uncharacterized protein n=1 Tax=Candidatus Woesebacteria bacterium RIFCSPHIGHO2_01_FULL_44_21 TaxID=1802503 RepID=A0A1F7Z2J9_9BACT|nr:MAG: hypothetical protein A2803_00280 [Candidatus Woesebacteria bacterium RIFCSPHIGHO2_01_FULL_44_21]OGM70589.1 MAG: hypothetical protein A2897_02175 [Candidatus Woesebacteria bacterium RIFCSPLOWO2_01_FULL_44_24b]
MKKLVSSKKLKIFLIILVGALLVIELGTRWLLGTSVGLIGSVLYPQPTPYIPEGYYFPEGPGRNFVIEDEGKVTVSERPEVVALAEKYGWDNVHIQALDIDLVSDLVFIKSLRPDFSDELGCVIVVHAGENEGYVYQENEDLEVIHMETMQEFLNKVKDKDPELLFKFFLSLH